MILLCNLVRSYFSVCDSITCYFWACKLKVMILINFNSLATLGCDCLRNLTLLRVSFRYEGLFLWSWWDFFGSLISTNSSRGSPIALYSRYTLCVLDVRAKSHLFSFFTTESEGEWVDYWFDVTNWSFCKHALQSRLWRQIRSRATPPLNRSWTKDAWFFESFQAFKMARFVRRRKKWPRCVSKGCKDSF